MPRLSLSFFTLNTLRELHYGICKNASHESSSPAKSQAIYDKKMFCVNLRNSQLLFIFFKIVSTITIWPPLTWQNITPKLITCLTSLGDYQIEHITQLVTPDFWHSHLVLSSATFQWLHVDRFFKVISVTLSLMSPSDYRFSRGN